MRVPKAAVWVVVVAVAMGLLVGAFLMVAVKKAVVLVAVGGVLVLVLVAVTWNCVWGRRGLLGFVRGYPDVELRGAIDGQYVKVTGVEEVVKMMETELGSGWIYHKSCKVIDQDDIKQELSLFSSSYIWPLVTKKVRHQLRMIFLQMGFEEMPTDRFVESRQQVTLVLFS